MGTPMVCIRDGSLPVPDASDTAFKGLVDFYGILLAIQFMK